MTLLPAETPNSVGIVTRGYTAGMSDILPVPIRETLDADTAPEEFLPFLAHGEGVKLWFDDWPLTRKRLVAKNWLKDYASLIGTRAAMVPFLDLVDAEIVTRVAYPQRFVLGRSALGRQRLQQKHHTAYYLVKVDLEPRANRFVLGRSALGRAALRPCSREPLRRAQIAMVAAKATDTQVTVTFGHRRLATVDDGFTADDEINVSHWINRTKL
jgi:P2-related tail formation protein